MQKYVACALMVIGLSSCVPTPENNPPAHREQDPGKTTVAIAPADKITLLITGHELGAMKPCGCSGGQLGGLDRRSAVIKRAPGKARLVIDTGCCGRCDQQ